MPAKSTGQRRYLTTNSAQTAFEITAIRRTLVNTSGVLSLVDNGGSFEASHQVVLLGDYRGARIQMFGTGADNDTANYRIWLVRGLYSSGATYDMPEASKCLDVELVPYIADTSTATLSTVLGIGTVAPQPLTSERFADTLTATLSSTATTPPGPATDLEAAYALGSARAYSPAANASAAELYIPDFGAGVMGFIIEWDLTGATGMNALVELTR